MKEGRKVGNLLYLDADFISEYANAVSSYVKDPSAINKAKLKVLHKVLRNCLTTHKALRTAKTEKQRVKINGGKAIRDKEKSKRKTKCGTTSKITTSRKRRKS